MKRFVSRLALLLLIPVLLMGAWTAFVVFMDWRSYRASLTLPPACDVAVCSDSQAQDGLNPAFMPRLYNFSTAASHPDQNLMRLKDLLSCNQGRLRFVLLDVTPIHVGFDERKVPLSEAGSARVHALLHAYHWREAKRPVGSAAMLFRDVVLIRKFHELRKALKRRIAYRSSLAGGFFAVATAGFVAMPEKAAADVAEKARRFNAKPPLAPASRIMDLMRESACAIRAAGAEPVFMTTPLSPRLKAAFDPVKVQALTNGVAALAHEMGAPYLNYLTFDLPEADWRDANHLNLAGAEAFTKRVAKDVEALRLP